MEHIDGLIDDFVLDLLPESKRQLVDSHIRNCSRCHTMVVAERRRTKELVEDLRLVSSAPAGRIKALYPLVAARARRNDLSSTRGWPQLRAAMTTLALALFILLGVLGTMNRQDGWLLYTYTPTKNTGTSLPTALTTATGSHTPSLPSMTAEIGPVVWGTPEPVVFVPQPSPIITAIPQATR